MYTYILFFVKKDRWSYIHTYKVTYILFFVKLECVHIIHNFWKALILWNGLFTNTKTGAGTKIMCLLIPYYLKCHTNEANPSIYEKQNYLTAFYILYVITAVEMPTVLMKMVLSGNLLSPQQDMHNPSRCEKPMMSSQVNNH